MINRILETRCLELIASFRENHEIMMSFLELFNVLLKLMKSFFKSSRGNYLSGFVRIHLAVAEVEQGALFDSEAVGRGQRVEDVRTNGLVDESTKSLL